jgi:tetratricopeptide (TPR) repeat protein
MGANQLDEAIRSAQSFFKDYPLSAWGPKLHLKLGNVLVRENRVSESLLHYQEAAETTVDSVTAFTALKNLGITYQDLKRWREAERVWTQMLNRFPESVYAPEAALNIARCKMEYGDYRGAISAYEKSLPLLDSEAKARAFYWMGTSYEQLGDYQSAVIQYLKVPYMGSGGGLWIVTAELKAAECYTRIDRNDAAREIYNRVIRNHGAGSNWGKLAQKGLDSIDQSESNDQQSTNTGGSNP